MTTIIKKYTMDDVRMMLGRGDKPASRNTIYRLMKLDEHFPTPISRMPLTWVADHIDGWIDSHNKLTAA